MTQAAQGFQNPLLHAPQHGMPSKIAIIGAGTIGPDIGYYLLSALPELTLYLVDIDAGALERATQRIEAYVEKGLSRKKLSENQAAAIRANLKPTLNYQDFADADWVLEAATENLALKHKIFAQVEEIVSPTALITSNTSSIPASRLFSELEHKNRATVTHFFTPAFKNPVVEVIRWNEGDDALVEYLRWFFCATGKVPIVTSDDIAFMLDRVFTNWCNEAVYLSSKYTPAQIDTVASEFVHAGPFFVLNLTNGNPIIVETNTLQMEEGEHYRPAPVLSIQGKWDTISPGGGVAVGEEAASEIRDRLLGILFSQSYDIIDRGIGSREDLNLGCILALGFKKGPLDLIQDFGEEEVRRIQEKFVAERPGMPTFKGEVGDYAECARHVLVDDREGVKLITLRRPQAMNALNDEVNDEILQVIKRYEKQETTVGFVLTGYGDRAFCAGADIGKFPRVLGDKKGAAQYARDCSELLVHMDQMDKPIVAAINGMALGGGFELALRCNAMVAETKAWFQFPEITLGILPGIGGMAVPYRRWPEAAGTFHDMIRGASRLRAKAAHEIGILSGLSDSYPGLIDLAVKKVRELSKEEKPSLDGAVNIPSPPESDAIAANGQQLSKEVTKIITQAIVDSAAAPTLDEALEVGYLAFAETACTSAAQEGIEAFFQKRRPNFGESG